MQHESAAILRLILAHYNEAVLLFYKSAGSSLERYFDMVVQRKIDESAAFFRSMGYTGIDEKLLGLLISVQFDSYRRVVLGSPDAATADGYMNSLMTYYLGGWRALFDSANKSEEDVKNEV